MSVNFNEYPDKEFIYFVDDNHYKMAIVDG